MEGDQTVLCRLLAVDLTDYCYRVCSRCERVLPPSDNNGVTSSICKFCKSKVPKLLYRILMSIATDTSVKTVICFDRVATVLFGCSADEFFHFTKLNPSTASMVNQVLDGEMFRMTLTRPHNRNAQHMRVASVVPLRSGFQPAIVTLRQLCTTKNASSLSNCSTTSRCF
uniref:Replication factor A C-terminal domain-containing protein n=1 Tax=Noccaea caerulescens TaxID=107243 RepID=A0A1J3HSS2_NOCCA